MSQKKKAYEMMEERRVRKENRDPLAEVIEEEDRELAREARRLRLQQIIAKRKKDIDAIEGEKGKESMPVASPGQGINPASALITTMIARGVQPDKANEYITALSDEAILKLSLMQSQNPNSMLPLFLLGRKDDTSTKEIVSTAKTMIELAKPSEKTGESLGGDLVTKLVTETLPDLQKEIREASTTAYQLQIQRLEKSIEDMKPMDPAEYVIKVRQSAEALGMRVPEPGGAQEAGIKKMQLDYERWKFEKEGEQAERQWERDRWQMEMGLKKNSEVERMRTIRKIAGDALKKAGPLLDAATDELEGGVRERVRGARRPRRVTLKKGVFHCPGCGTDIPIEGEPESITCPECDATYGKNPMK